MRSTCVVRSRLKTVPLPCAPPALVVPYKTPCIAMTPALGFTPSGGFPKLYSTASVALQAEDGSVTTRAAIVGRSVQRSGNVDQAGMRAPAVETVRMLTEVVNDS